MSYQHTARRLLAQARDLGTDNPCPRPRVGLIVAEGEPYDPADGVPCPRCGAVHVLAVAEEIVTAEPQA